jgi:hypothetical protein
MDERRLSATITGDYFQPVRLHYRVLDREAVLRGFKKLRCMEYHATQDRWVWLYQHEARRLHFKRSYDDIPQHLQPIVLGSFFLRAADKMLLDLRSCERTIHAIPFFDKHLSRKAAEVVEAEIVNKLFPLVGNETLTPDKLFDRHVSIACDPDALVQRVIKRMGGNQDPAQMFASAMAEFHAKARQALPEIERFPVHYYEDGIDGFVLALRVRQMVAMHHWLGNHAFTMSDALQALRNPKSPPN